MAEIAIVQDRIVNYEEGSLAGVPFQIRRHSYRGSHRVAEYKYPESDRVEYARQGRDKFEFSLSAYVVGNTPGDPFPYERKRDELLQVLRAGGTATLVHPYLGTVRVQIRSFTMVEETEEMGLAKFRITLSQEDQIQTRQQDIQLITAFKEVEIASAQLIAATAEEVSKKLDEGLEQARNPSLANKLLNTRLLKVLTKGLLFASTGLIAATKALAFVAKGIERAIDVIEKIRKWGKRINDVKKALAQIRARIDQLIMSGATTVRSLYNTIRPGYNPYGEYPSVTEAFEMFREYVTLSGISATQQTDELSLQIDKAINIFSLGTACEMATTIPFADRSALDEAEYLLNDALNDQLASENLTAQERQHLRGLKAATMDYLRLRRGAFSNRTIEVPYDQNMLTMVYNESGTIADSEYYSSLNRIDNPLFLQQGTQLELNI